MRALRTQKVNSPVLSHDTFLAVTTSAVYVRVWRYHADCDVWVWDNTIVGNGGGDWALDRIVRKAAEV